MATLIVTNEVDASADRMVSEMSRRGEPVLRWHTDRLAEESSLSVEVDSRGARCRLSSYGRSLEALDIRSIWYRKPKPLKLPAGLSAEEKSFAQQEMAQALNGFMAALDVFWVSEPGQMRRASYKPLQLKAAAEAGLEIPPTLVSNDPADIRRFCAEPGRPVVYKTLHSPVVGRHTACFTSILTPKDVDRLELIRTTAGIFQAYVEKKFELRIVAVGTRLFAFEIHSQDNPLSQVDWRRLPPDKMRHSVHRLPAEVSAKIVKLMNCFGLAFAAMDLILTPDGRYVFLEINPGGQFGWLEDMTAVPLTAMLADMLVAGRPI